MKDPLQSPKLRAILVILGAVIVLLVVFALGTAVGYHRALFASRFGENYYNNFYGGPPGRMSFSMHGVAGEVIDLGSSTISVKDQDGDEQSVEISSTTVIRKEDSTVTLDQVDIGDMITVIGGPNATGQIEARFIRIFPASSSMPGTMPTQMPMIPASSS
jgi:hypothetical protein